MQSMMLLCFWANHTSTSWVLVSLMWMSGSQNVGCKRDKGTRCWGQKAVQWYSTTNHGAHIDAWQTLDGDFPSSTDGENPVIGREYNGMYVLRVFESEKESIMHQWVPKGDSTFCRKCKELLMLWQRDAWIGIGIRNWSFRDFEASGCALSQRRPVL